MTDAELARLQALADAATPGPWMHQWSANPLTGDGFGEVLRVWGGPRAPVVGGDGSQEYGGVFEEEDGDLIAASRMAIPALIDEVRRLRAALEAIVAVSDANPTPRLDPELGWVGPRGRIIYQSGAEAWDEAAAMSRAALRRAGEGEFHAE